MRPPVKKRGPQVQRDPVPGTIFLSIVAVLLAVVPFPSWAIEQVYGRNIYPTLQSGVTAVTNLIPLALLDLFIAGALILTVFRIARLIRVARGIGVGAAFIEGLRKLIRAVAILVIVFLVFWGMNYRRAPLEETLKVPATPLTVTDLTTAIADANALAIRVRLAPEATRPRTYEGIAKDLSSPFNLAMKKIGRPALLSPGRPKYSLILTPFFTWSGVTGMIDPFALESIVHPDLLPFERPFVLGHEWAHLAGHADEAEASAVGWLACMYGDAGLAYSASLFVIQEAGSALPTPVWTQAQSKLDPGVLTDLAAIDRRMALERPIISHTTAKIYDQYLEANHVDDGVLSYRRSLRLILSPAMREAMATYTIRGR